MPKQVKISIVTINFNDAVGLKRTFESVKNVLLDSVEYIVVDGGSSDGSDKVISEYEGLIDKKIVGSDDGIYDAMNKGAEASRGEWVIFMNSGDEFARGFSFESIPERCFQSQVQVIAGKALKVSGQLIWNEFEGAKSYTQMGVIPYCHQAMMFRVPIKYNLDYRIYSDFDLFVAKAGWDLKALSLFDGLVAIYDQGGISEQEQYKKEKRKEKFRIVRIYGGVLGLLRAFCFAVVNRLSK